MRTGVRVLAAVIGTGVAVACSDPKPAPLPSTSPSTVAPTTPSPTPTASANYEAEARRAIDAYFAALNAALRDPANRTDALAALIDPSCRCTDAVRALRAEAGAGRYLDYRYTLSNVRVLEAGSLGATVSFTAHQSAGHQRSRDGRVLRSFAATAIKYSAHFRRDNDAWRLDRLDQMR